MAKYGAFSSISDLKDWFDDNAERHGVTQWILYHGHVMRTTGPGGQRAASQKEENMSQDDSWNLLENYLTKMGQQGGTFTLYMPTRNTQVGERVFVSLPGAGQAGIGGVYGQGYVEKEIEQFKREFMLQQQIEELRAEMETRKNPLEQIAQQLLDSGVAAQVIQGFAAKAMGLTGFPATPQPYGQAGSDDEPENNYSQEQVQDIESALARLAGHFPRLDGVLNRLADFVDSNPEMARQFLDNLGKNNRNEGL